MKTDTILPELAKQYGTPLYVYSEEKVRERFAALKESLSPVKPLLCFAMKANSTLGILRLFKELGSGFDIVSEGELRRVLKVGGDPSKVVFSGVGKTPGEIEFALKCKIKFINVESVSELHLIEKVAKKVGVRAPFCFRINPDVTAKTHKHLTTGTKSSKFGIPFEQALEAWEALRNSEHLDFVGLDCHIGSQITEIAPLKSAYVEVLRLTKLFEKAGAKIRTLDLGGGFGISYSGHYPELNLEALSKMVSETLGGSPYEFVFEPGRFLIAEAGTLLTRVVHKKENQGKHFAIVDAGMNDLVRPAMYDAFHQIDKVSSNPTTNAGPIDIVGPVCESGCYFAHDRLMPDLQSGDLLAIRDAGAYGSVMGSDYNSRPRPAEVLVRADNSVQLLRRRESFEELWAREL